MIFNTECLRINFIYYFDNQFGQECKKVLLKIIFYQNYGNMFATIKSQNTKLLLN